MPVRVVVGAAMVRERRVLAARRSAPDELAGGWEFPGGKVEAGESEPAALIRECQEELGVEVTVGELLGSALIAAKLELHVYRVELVAGQPRPLQDHDQLRWLAAGELESVDWLSADRPALTAVAAVLGCPG